MSKLSHAPPWLVKVPRRLFRRAWFVTALLAVVIVISAPAGFVIPVPMLILLTTVAISGALGGLTSGFISGLLMAATVMYFWWNGIGPTPLTGTFARALVGSVTALAVGSYLGLMREQLSTLLSELESRQQELTQMNNELADRVARRTEDLQRVSDRLRDSQDRLLHVTRRWIQTEEKERRHLARNLHDDIGQGLTALHLNMESNKKSFMEVPRLQDFAATATELLKQITGSVRLLSMKLRPSLLDDLGLVAAIREHASMQFDLVGIESDLQHEGTDENIDPDTGITAFRLVQEAITNVVKHSEATHVTIGFQIGNEDLRITIRDNGKGFDTSRMRNGSEHYGIIGMQERASMMSGSCEVRSGPGAGTDIEITLPLPNQEAAA